MKLIIEDFRIIPAHEAATARIVAEHLPLEGAVRKMEFAIVAGDETAIGVFAVASDGDGAEAV